MPLYTTIAVNDQTKVYVWKITEDFDTLFKNTPLRDVHLARLEKMLSITHKRGFLSVRHLLKAAGYSDLDLFYDENGKPFLADGRHISISHSFDFSTIIIGNSNVGIDIEKQREKIIRIADKFIGAEHSFLNPQIHYVEHLSIIWGAKEALFKMCDSRSLSFKQDMHIQDFTDSFHTGNALVDCKEMNFSCAFTFHFETFENYTLVYALENE